MNNPLISPVALERVMLEAPVTLVRAQMKDPVTQDADDTTRILPQSVDFDLDGEGSDHDSGLPHSMPGPEHLAGYLGRLGITRETKVVAYDTRGIYSAPRVWWMLKAMGHTNVSILDGGAPAWEQAGLPINVERPGAVLRQYTPAPEAGWFVNSSAVLAAQNTQAQVVDARSPDRFYGKEQEPRSGVRRGHIPGSVNLHYQSLLRDGKYLEQEELKEKFAQSGVDLGKPIICTCGSGITACIIGVAAKMLGAGQVSVYDGSWSEWGANTQYPVETA